MNQIQYPKRLIEVDLPIKEISKHARREKSIRHGHISTLHIWWARRPLAACRAVICAALWPDPADPLCPERFKEDAAAIMARFWNPLGSTDMDYREPLALRKALLDFIADFANWDHSTDQRYLETSRSLTQSAHESLGGVPGTRPLVVDPFAGGGSIPLEALRVGADAFASDLNPVAVLLNKVVLEYIPKYGQKLADEVRRWGEWIKVEAEKELAEFYPKDPDGTIPIAYLWARTIICEGPGCGAEVPLMRSLWLAKKSSRSVALKFTLDREKKRVDFEIIQNVQAQDVGEATVRRGSATCPVCGYTTPVASVRKQLKARRGGAADSRLIAVRRDDSETGERSFRLSTKEDYVAYSKANEELKQRQAKYRGQLSLIPDEATPLGGGRGAGRAFSQRNYGMDRFEDLFSPRQLLALTTFVQLVREAGEYMSSEGDSGLGEAVKTCLGLGLNRLADFNSSLCVLNVVGGRGVVHTFGRQAIPIVWDFMETNPFNDVGANWITSVDVFEETINRELVVKNSGQIEKNSALLNPMPDDTAQLFFTDPPYYDAVPYADLSDFFYVWLKRTQGLSHPKLLGTNLTQKDDECIVDEIKNKDKKYFESAMAKAMSEGRRVLSPDGICVIVFAHKSTSGWEAILQAMIDAGWIFTGSWPIDTERPGRLRAQDSAALASSIHLVCRPREHPSGEVRTDDVGDWREVLSELPQRIHAWLPRLAQEGVVGADAIFSCLGPALEIYSRYSRVEKVSGEQVTLSEYLQEVWAAVSREALGTIFSGDTSSFEEDARLTAMWLWTLMAGANGNGNSKDDEAIEEEDEKAPSKSKLNGFILEFDAARKIAQGLGVRLENLPGLVEIKADKARLLPVSERAPYLLGQEVQPVRKRKRDKTKQTTLHLDDLPEEAVIAPVEARFFSPGSTALDRVHQAMLLFGEGRGDGLKTFLQEIGQDQGFWSLAQALNSLYPVGSEERRWVEGVLARKKSMGL
ncbi:MAG: DUF1156 domain-containing protein [Euryarchaeota archaeon]|jgi:adenine-specific DNA methylase|nr:DUF1156 domain-containing protein [Euryarchaeota archaeon]